MKKEIKWSIDPAHSDISFKVRHLLISQVKGSFKTFEATIYTTEKDFTTAEINLIVDASSISTGDEKRDDHLKSDEFLDVAKHKQIIFTATTIGKADADGKREMWGELTLRGKTKNVKLNVEFGGIEQDEWGNERAEFKVTGKIKRSEWGLVWNADIEADGLMEGDDVNIACEVQLVNAGEGELVMELDSQTERQRNNN